MVRYEPLCPPFSYSFEQAWSTVESVLGCLQAATSRSLVSGIKSA